MGRKSSLLVALIAPIALAVLTSACTSGSSSSTPAPAASSASQAPATSSSPSAASSGAPAATSQPTAQTTVALPLVVCPTTIALAATPAPKPQPPVVTVNVPVGMAAGLAVYTDDQGTMRIVGPQGWSCSAQYGADGSGGVAVTAPGVSVPKDWGAGWRLSTGSSVQAIVGSQTSACTSCGEAQACPLFGTAAKSFQANFGRACPGRRPAAETTTQISANVMAFADPAGVLGDGNPSGGLNPANGVMTYYSGNQNASWVETCTLPAASKNLCTATLDYFLASYGSR